jgi:uncharacterized repeat protein (TIGR03943 family)
MRRDIQGVVLALVGATILRLSFTDIMLSYVKPGMRPFLMASGVVLVVLGLLSVILDSRQPASADADGTGTKPEPDHEHQAPRAAWLLVVPVFLVFVVAPPALGAFAADRVPTALPQEGEWTMKPLPDDDPVTLALRDYAYRATWDGGGTLQDRRVELTGFVTPNEDGEGWVLNRLQLNCCAADARVSRVLVTDAALPPADAWVTVVGSYSAPLNADTDEPTPVIAAESVQQVPQPRNPYE